MSLSTVKRGSDDLGSLARGEGNLEIAGRTKGTFIADLKYLSALTLCLLRNSKDVALRLRLLHFPQRSHITRSSCWPLGTGALVRVNVNLTEPLSAVIANREEELLGDLAARPKTIVHFQPPC